MLASAKSLCCACVLYRFTDRTDLTIFSEVKTLISVKYKNLGRHMPKLVMN